MVIRTFRRTWKVVWKGKRDKHGRKLFEKVGDPTQEVAWHVTSFAPEDLGCVDVILRPVGFDTAPKAQAVMLAEQPLRPPHH